VRGGSQIAPGPPVRASAFAALLLLTAMATALPPPAAAQGAAFDEARLAALLANNPATGRLVDSVSELVPLLPQELRSNFTFVYRSRSPFRASISPDYPRIILFTPDARFVLTFTGDEHAPGANLLESMSFDQASASFKLRAWLLPAAQRTGWRPSPKAAKCERCHGADPRPIFDAYPLWPGFYGAQQDTFPRDRLGLRELRRYAHFLAGPAKTGVYVGLIFPAGSPVSPYLDPKSFDPRMVEAPAEPLKYLPNTRLGMALTELNRARIYRKLAAGPGFAANEKLILADLLECKPAHAPARRAVRRIEAQVARENGARLVRLGLRRRDPRPERNDMQELQFGDELAQIDQAAARAGVDRFDWSMALEPGSLAFFDGILSGMHGETSYYLKEDLIYEMLDHLRAREAAFTPYFAVISAYGDLGYPFGHRIDIGTALGACPRLRGGAHAAAR